MKNVHFDLCANLVTFFNNQNCEIISELAAAFCGVAQGNAQSDSELLRKMPRFVQCWCASGSGGAWLWLIF